MTTEEKKCLNEILKAEDNNIAIAALRKYENHIIDETLQKLYDNGYISDLQAFYSTGWYIKSRVEFKYGDHWRPEIGSLVFMGDTYELPFGDYDNKDEIWLRIKYQF